MIVTSNFGVGELSTSTFGAERRCLSISGARYQARDIRREKRARASWVGMRFAAPPVRDLERILRDGTFRREFRQYSLWRRRTGCRRGQSAPRLPEFDAAL